MNFSYYWSVTIRTNSKSSFYEQTSRVAIELWIASEQHYLDEVIEVWVRSLAGSRHDQDQLHQRGHDTHGHEISDCRP